ncbi:hypothetical protein PG988_013813 [Apiospora saccharicola]
MDRSRLQNPSACASRGLEGFALGRDALLPNCSKSENIAEFMCDSLTCRARHKKCDENRMLSTEPRCLNWS